MLFVMQVSYCARRVATRLPKARTRVAVPCFCYENPIHPQLRGKVAVGQPALGSGIIDQISAQNAVAPARFNSRNRLSRGQAGRRRTRPEKTM